MKEGAEMAGVKDERGQTDRIVEFGGRIDNPAQYQSPPESIELARKGMSEVKEALTTDAQGRFPAGHAELREALGVKPDDPGWLDMDMGARYDLLQFALGEMVWSLEPAKTGGELGDSQKLALEFVKDEERQLHAEMRHDHGLRVLEDRLVKYEDATERTLDHPQEREARQEPAEAPHRDPPQPAPNIGIQPGQGNPLDWRDDRSFDIHDATGKIGYLTGYLGGPWSDAEKDTEFRVTHVEITEPGRRLAPDEWKNVLHGLRQHLPDVAELIGGNRGGEGGDLSPAYEKLVRLPPRVHDRAAGASPPPEAAKQHNPAAGSLFDSTTHPDDKFYIMAVQNPDQGEKWSFVAGPYDSEAMAKGNQASAAREYAARNHQPEWFAGATIRVVHGDMWIPTALGSIQAKEDNPAATREERGQSDGGAGEQGGKRLPSPGQIAEDRDGPEIANEHQPCPPERGPSKGRGK